MWNVSSRGVLVGERPEQDGAALLLYGVSTTMNAIDARSSALPPYCYHCCSDGVCCAPFPPISRASYCHALFLVGYWDGYLRYGYAH